MHRTIVCAALVLAAVLASLTTASAQSGARMPDLAAYHVESLKLSCSTCHGDKSPLALNAEESLAVSNRMCLACHGDAKSLADKIAPKLAHKEINPHASHLVQIDCVTCHSAHQAKETYCNQCHAFDMPMPPRAAKR